MSKDYYKTLGVDKKAGKDEIKKAFRNLAHKYHPDKGGDAEKFKEINEAYSVLSDDQKRAQYDQFGNTGPQYNTGQNGFSGFEGFDFGGFRGGFGNSQSFEFDLGDIFGDIFGGGGRGREKIKRGKDISVDIEISFKESVFGTQKQIILNKTSACDICKGDGVERGSEMINCNICNGKGTIREVKQSFFGQFEANQICKNCRGVGKIPKIKCKQCKGEGVFKKQSEIKIKIPEGIENGEVLRLSGAGEAVSFGTTGDLYIKIWVREDQLFKREGLNLFMDLDIKISEAILGTERTIKTLDGDVSLKVPEGIQYGEYLKIKGRGVPSQRGRGDILVKIIFTIPNKISKDLRKKIEDLKKEGI